MYKYTVLSIHFLLLSNDSFLHYRPFFYFILFLSRVACLIYISALIVALPPYHSTKFNSIQASRIQAKIEFPYRLAASNNCRLNTYFELNSTHTCRSRLWSPKLLVNKQSRALCCTVKLSFAQ